MLHRLLLMGLLVPGLVACNKLLNIPPNEEIDIDEAFSDSTSAVAAISGIYTMMRVHGYFECSGLSYYTARSADDAVYRRSTDYFALDSLLYTNLDVAYIWSDAFNSLWTINTFLRGLQSATNLSTSLYGQLLGEALFCRAFVNFNLVNCWGDALPLITAPDVQTNRKAKSVPRQQLYNQILSDLLQARELLTDVYPGNGRVRPNRMVVAALLSRVYLYLNKYNEAIANSNILIGSGLYALSPAPGDAFLKDSREAIWQLMPAVGSGVTGAVADVLLYQKTATSLTPQLLAAFEPGDLRRQAWVINNVFSGNTYTTANKYKDQGFTGNTAPAEYYMMLRLAEQYLIRAEANTCIGQTTAAVADLNVLRARAGLSELPVSLTQQQCMAAVEHERQVELFTEWGHRWFDLKRWPAIGNPQFSRADEVLGASKRDWQSTDQWYPVPRSELQVNPFLVQNPGYPVR